ncbi:MAG: tetratricopeptide repeat protein [Gammaproteobacteria bacterium]|mgnify:FL=1|jgi:predicted negative regulator of RcsB-dependent stress response|nr:tetratricopeptide repeat protein [Gammaproteobacteria bacterium]MDC0484946.1 tetratricopeptide repeat protein [Gammaproteobacteria bacterium]
MAEFNSDEERFAAIVNFFKDNKNFLLIGFALISIVLITSISYQSFTSNQNARAAEIYDAWFTGLAAESADSDETNINFNSLQEKYANTGYGQLARMIRGSSLAREGDLESALLEFQELSQISSGLFGNDLLNSIAQLNIARIELSKNNYSNALKALESFNSDSEHPLVYELKGDALLGLKKNNLALDQFSLAIENTIDESQKSLLKMKVNNITQ